MLRAGKKTWPWGGVVLREEKMMGVRNFRIVQILSRNSQVDPCIRVLPFIFYAEHCTGKVHEFFEKVATRIGITQRVVQNITIPIKVLTVLWVLNEWISLQKPPQLRIIDTPVCVNGAP